MFHSKCYIKKVHTDSILKLHRSLGSQRWSGFISNLSIPIWNEFFPGHSSGRLGSDWGVWCIWFTHGKRFNRSAHGLFPSPHSDHVNTVRESRRSRGRVRWSCRWAGCHRNTSGCADFCLSGSVSITQTVAGRRWLCLRWGIVWYKRMSSTDCHCWPSPTRGPPWTCDPSRSLPSGLFWSLHNP